jgi:hypothetical protein
MNLLFIGDIFGKPGRRAVTEMLPALRRELAVDFCVANAENAASGAGITPEIAAELLEAGADVETTPSTARRGSRSSTTRSASCAPRTIPRRFRGGVRASIPARGRRSPS